MVFGKGEIMIKTIVVENDELSSNSSQRYVGQVVTKLLKGTKEYICECKDKNIVAFSHKELESLEIFGPSKRDLFRASIADIEEAYINKKPMYVKIGIDGTYPIRWYKITLSHIDRFEHFLNVGCKLEEKIYNSKNEQVISVTRNIPKQSVGIQNHLFWKILETN
jgi:hypothetical protein